ncbi:hypothetical protein HK104_003612, partial [Borealophlyctis nickersoniae]
MSSTGRRTSLHMSPNRPTPSSPARLLTPSPQPLDPEEPDDHLFSPSTDERAPLLVRLPTGEDDDDEEPLESPYHHDEEAEEAE